MIDPVEAYSGLPAKRIKECQASSKISSISAEGTHTIFLLDEMYEEEKINEENCYSGDDFMRHLAQTLKNEGDDPKVRAELVQQIRVMSYFVTQRLVPTHIVDFEAELSGERAVAIDSLQLSTSLPAEGLYLLDELDKAVADGTSNKEDFLSGQDILLSASQELESDGSDTVVRERLVKTLGLMSYYATQKFVPFFYPDSDSE